MVVTQRKRPIRVGIAGVGVFGGNHAKKLVANSGAFLVGIYDRDPARAVGLAVPLGAKGFDDRAALLSEIEARVVATSAIAHGGVARAAIDAGRHCTSH